ncbi:MAG: nucleotidyltransferase family protein [Methanophagales archaeon]|nr:nucleotidyltransferase family protein [Methanophagales archaeon]
MGSYARGEQKETSDLDVIVEFEKRKSLLELVGIEQELEDNLGIKIDLLTEDSISPYLIEKIRKESKVILNNKDEYTTKIVGKEEAERKKEGKMNICLFPTHFFLGSMSMNIALLLPFLIS